MIRSKTVSIFRCLACVGVFIVHFGIIMKFKGRIKILIESCDSDIAALLFGGFLLFFCVKRCNII